jgi:hypothetical protein
VDSDVHLARHSHSPQEKLQRDLGLYTDSSIDRSFHHVRELEDELTHEKLCNLKRNQGR